jgi:N-acetylglucosaminyl-diphospho-decaprenol L-rhamnosyltransferase
MDVSVLIISYNTRELTLACLQSVFARTRDVAFEVIVVDNASTDGSPAAIAERFPQVKLLALERNVGFARGNNLVARHAAGRFLLLLNPDTVVLDRAIDTLVRFADSNPDAGVFGGRTLYADGTLNNTSCFGQPSLWSMWCAGVGLSSVFRNSSLFNPELMGAWGRDSVRPVGVVTGCFLLIGRELWEHLGGFDESFFMYSEDTDLSLRAWKAGRRCVHCPDAVIIHHGGRSEETRAAKLVKVFTAKAQFVRKHWSPRRAWIGIRLLDLYALSRLAVHSALCPAGLSIAASRQRWFEIWTRRDEWRRTSVAPAGRPSEPSSAVPALSDGAPGLGA